MLFEIKVLIDINVIIFIGFYMVLIGYMGSGKFIFL